MGCGMNYRFLTLFIIIISTVAHSAVYHFFSVEKLTEAALEWEKSQVNPKAADLNLVSGYAGYIGALFDYLSEKQHICAPDEITKNEVLSVVTNYLKNQRKAVKNAGSVLVEEVLYKKYSCAK
jgi:hypothetical protein